MESEDLADRLVRERDDDFKHFAKRLSDEELDASLARGVNLHERLTRNGADRAILERVALRLREMMQEQQLRAVSQLIPLPRRPLKLMHPPRLVYDRLLQRLLQPAVYRRFVEPHIEDMHEEYFQCLVQKDERGARWAVIRAHLYVIPSWGYALLASLIARVIEWIRT